MERNGKQNRETGKVTKEKEKTKTITNNEILKIRTNRVR